MLSLGGSVAGGHSDPALHSPPTAGPPTRSCLASGQVRDTGGGHLWVLSPEGGLCHLSLFREPGGLCFLVFSTRSSNPYLLVKSILFNVVDLKFFLHTAGHG